MVELVPGFQVQKQRRVAVLLQDGRGAQRTFQAVGAAVLDDTPKRPQSLSLLFPVVRKLAQEFLHLLGRSATLDNRAFRRAEGIPARRRRRRVVACDDKAFWKHGGFFAGSTTGFNRRLPTGQTKVENRRASTGSCGGRPCPTNAR